MARFSEFTEDLYAVLDVARDAGDDEIRRAARARQREAHPDLGGSAEAFMRVRVAVEVLTDPRSRADHDAWLDGRGRGPLGRRRTQRRSTPPTATSTSAGRDAGGPTGPAGATRPPGTFVPRAEAPPPERIPKPDTDVRGMTWFRTAWPATATQWPPSAARLPQLRGRELVAVALHAAALVATTLLLVLPVSIAQLRFPALTPGDPGAPAWPIVVVFAGFGVAWLACRVAVRAPRFAVAAHAVTVAIAGISAVMTAGLALFALVATPGGFASPVFHILALQSLLYAAYAITGVVAWRALEGRKRRVLRDRLLVGLAAASAPPVDDPTRVWGKPGEAATGGDDMPSSVNPMRAMLAQRIVGEAIEQLQRIPGVRVVHGLRASGMGTVPHAVIAGRRIALIDAQLWAPGRYGVGPNGMITRDGDDVPTAAVEFPHIVERYHRLFGESAQVRGWITVLPERDGDLDIDTSRMWQRVRLATLPETLREVGDWLADEGERVDRLLVRDLLRHRA